MPYHTIFPDAEHFTMLGLCISMGVYGWILLTAADMIGDGAESLLEAMPRHGALIGGLLVPILGAIPDGMMILLSGMGHGTKDEIQRQLNVGVGTLAGSTIMLLTVPFGIAIFVNRRPVENGRAVNMEEKPKEGGGEMSFTANAKRFQKFTMRSIFTREYWKTEDNNGNLFPIGASVEQSFPLSARIMMGSTVTYLIVQIPAFFASREIVQDAAFLSFIASLVLLGMYCYHNATQQGAEENFGENIQLRRRLRRREDLRLEQHAQNFRAFAKIGKSIDDVFKSLTKGKQGLNKKDVKVAFQSLGLNLGDMSLEKLFCEIDLDNNDIIDLTEFKQFFIMYISEFASGSLDMEQVKQYEEDDVKGGNNSGDKDPNPEILITLEKWMGHELALEGYGGKQKKKGQSFILYLKNLKKLERKRVHRWCNRKEEEIRKKKASYTIQHYSEPYIDAEDFTKPKRRLRIELCTIEHGKARYDPKLHRWACASGEIQKFCVKKFQNRDFDTFFAECLSFVGKGGSSTAQDSRILSEDDVVKLSKKWKLPVCMEYQDEKKQDAAICSEFQKILHRYQRQEESMTKDMFKLYLEGMVLIDKDHCKATMHKDFGVSCRNVNNNNNNNQKTAAAAAASRQRKTTTTYPAASYQADESSSLKSMFGTKHGYNSLEEGNIAVELPEKKSHDEQEAGENNKDEHSIKGPLLWMLWGSILVAVFSDPMVDMIDEFSNRVQINAFYVSFIVTPLVSNASEVLCAAKLASKLTDKTLNFALSTLYGAAVMNSTFCMAIFAGLVYFRGLEWNYSAEVLIIIIVMYVIGGLGLSAPNQTFSITAAGIALSMFPFSLVFVFVCQNVIGMA
mmetsp:Transcript_36465/g.59081  ORF Transcript_36465/g.59081 Transcript_36465/m.59081 type:complete len:848 (+) Transcript_36465:3-2546(+)